MTGRAFGLTRRGWTVAGSAVGLFAGGRLLGADELTVVALAALVILVGAGTWAAFAPTALAVVRRVDPPRLHVGDSARTDLVVTAPRATGLVDLTEPIDEDRLRARFLLASLAKGSTAEAAYRLPTERRGPLRLGPTTVIRADPLGLARRRRPVAPAEVVLVRPHVFAIAPPVLGAGLRHSTDDGESSRAPADDAHGEFLAVRPYEVGDDPRRVHWRSSARTGDLMVRQFVAPRRGQTVVVLDTRAEDRTRTDADADLDADADGADPRAGTSPAFERAVEATASIVSSLQRARRPVECLTSSGAVLTHRGDAGHRVLDRLATVMMDEPDLLDALARRRPDHLPELVVLVTARYDDHVRMALRTLARQAPAILVVTGGTTPDPRAAVVVDARTVAFPDAWLAVTRNPRRVGYASPARPVSTQ